jgi:hypothetical protein
MEVGVRNGSHRLTVGKAMGRPPAASTPRFTAATSSGAVRWQLLKSEPVSAMPTTGRSSMACE